MPPKPMSRHLFTAGIRQSGITLLTDRERFPYRSFHDNRVHVASEGDTLWHLAGRYFSGLPRACGLWWVIADFQPDPIHDPTLTLEAGRKIIIPSVRVVRERLFDARARSREAVP